MRVVAFSATLFGLVLAGCGQQAADTANQPGEAVPAGAAATSGAGVLWASGEKRPLDIQVAHPNGVVLQLTSVQSKPTETAIGVRVINGRNRAVDLNRFNSNRDGYLAIDTGERLYLSAPSNNVRMSVEPGQTMEGELVFLGKLPQSSNAVLILNENSQTDSQHTSTPGFRINLPLSKIAGGPVQ